MQINDIDPNKTDYLVTLTYPYLSTIIHVSAYDEDEAMREAHVAFEDTFGHILPPYQDVLIEKA